MLRSEPFLILTSHEIDSGHLNAAHLISFHLMSLHPVDLRGQDPVGQPDDAEAPQRVAAQYVVEVFRDRVGSTELEDFFRSSFSENLELSIAQRPRDHRHPGEQQRRRREKRLER